METSLEEVQQESINKKSVERSAAYAAITIEDAIKFVSEVYKNFRNAYAKRQDILALIDNSHPRHIAAASYYLLLNRERDTYQVSDTYKAIKDFLSERERITNLLKAFAAPKLNSELIEKFDGDEVPKELKVHLTRFHKITDEAAPLASEVFIKNAKYCGVLDENNILNYKKAVLRLSDTSYQPLPANSEEKPPTEDNVQPLNSANSSGELGVGETPALPPSNKPQLLIEEMVNKEEIKIKLTGRRFAYLIFPFDLNKTDVAILQKQIEQLALVIE